MKLFCKSIVYLIASTLLLTGCNASFNSKEEDEQINELQQKYAYALDAEEKGFYMEAIQLYEQIKDYSDSSERCKTLNDIITSYNGVYRGNAYTLDAALPATITINNGKVTAIYDNVPNYPMEFQMFRYGTNSDGTPLMGFGSVPYAGDYVPDTFYNTYAFQTVAITKTGNSYLICAASNSSNTNWNGTYTRS